MPDPCYFSHTVHNVPLDCYLAIGKIKLPLTKIVCVIVSELISWILSFTSFYIAQCFSACCFTYWYHCCFQYSCGYFVTWKSILYCKWPEKINKPMAHDVWKPLFLGCRITSYHGHRGLRYQGISFMKSPAVNLRHNVSLLASGYTGY